jgi:pimeloyl-ACP methyl ester carboxylesterase
MRFDHTWPSCRCSPDAQLVIRTFEPAPTAGLTRFPLFGFSQGCAVSIAFAARHPDRVSNLILYGSFAVGSKRLPNLTAADKGRFAATKTLMKLGWGSDDPTFRQIFTAAFWKQHLADFMKELPSPR